MMQVIDSENNEELKPCPFCGGKCCICPVTIEEDFWVAHCMDCDCRIWGEIKTKEEAIEAWNTRSAK